MSKVYKGYELIKAIADGEIKEDTKFREMEENRYYIVKDRKLWEQGDTGIYTSKLENLQIIYGAFELIGDEIDIDSIEELTQNCFDDWTEAKKNQRISTSSKATKQRNKKYKEK